MKHLDLHAHSVVLMAAWVGGATGFEPAQAQITISESDLPAKVGDYSRAYVAASSVDVSNLIGPAGGPYVWDFSRLKIPGETRQRFEIVLPAAVPVAPSYPGAQYVERLTIEPDTLRSHSFYSISAAGRSYYGFQQAQKAPVVFASPTIDLPVPIQFGRSWSRTVRFDDVLDTGLVPLRVAITFTSEATVDAYGTIILPKIGAIPALRLNEANTYVLRDTFLGLPLQTQYFRNYSWIVRGIGTAAQIIAKGDPETPPAQFRAANTVLRVFEASQIPDRFFLPVTGLQVRLQGSTLLLDWKPEPSASGYRIETTSDIARPVWVLLDEPLTNQWSEPLLKELKQRYYRVLIKPAL